MNILIAYVKKKKERKKPYLLIKLQEWVIR